MFDYSDESAKKAQETFDAMLEKPARKIKLPKVLAVINQSGCTGCEACIQFCPVDCIEIVPGTKFVQHGQTVEVDLDRCIGCKLCAKYCPWDTIDMIASDVAFDKANEWTLKTVVKLPRQGKDMLWGAEEEESAPAAETAAAVTDVDSAAAAPSGDEPPQA
ncbi:MAG TPA: 4Fe-4S dicluster-binding protein [Bdellovibrionota bacterium]|jgi:ferredoxin|nr:4Fe-4S dicluster-binding protein [Bdellovibrionota bacterium]